MTDSNQTKTQNEFETDSLSSGIAFMMALAIAQRGVGFLRTAMFCRLLPEQELGQWSLVFSFVMLSAPMTLMGITGSFGRYVEHYFQRGLVRAFFRQTAMAVAGLTLLVLCGMWLTQDHVSWALFGSVEQKHLLLPACLTLATNILYNYFLEVAIALRRIKVGSIMELISSWTFAAIAITTLCLTNWGAYGVVLGFAAGNLFGALYACYCLFRVWDKLPNAKDRLAPTALWRKLAPFALGLWIVNIVTNLFDLSDRYMIIHFSGFESGEAQGLVGQYFSSMAVPLLMVGLSTTLSHLVMPYLSQDWENGKFLEVSNRVNLSFKMLGLLMCVASAGVLLIAPVLFDVVFGGKYNAGLVVLPFTIAFCFWRAVSMMGYNYLYCVEQPRLMCASLGLSLLVNIVLNAMLLPPLGLMGAALATSISSLLNLAIILACSIKFGFQASKGLTWILLFPALFPFGATVTALGLVVLFAVSLRSEWFFSNREREELEEILQGVLVKVMPARWQSKVNGLRSTA